MSTALHTTPSTTTPGRTPALTERELVILGTIEEDRTLADIAAELFVSRNTVKSHLHNVYRKLGVSTRADALARAHEYGLR